jgi:signal transduction histidine kinase
MEGNVQMEMTLIDVASLLQTATQGLQPAADAKRVEMIASVESGTGQVFADSRRLQQVLWNLVHNAIKFTPSGGRVEIHIQRAQGCVQITVRDNGQGISAAFLPHVFERFRQEDSSTTQPSSGLGLGLSITKHIVELHGGSISVVSPGQGLGATFVVRVPASMNARADSACVA